MQCLHCHRQATKHRATCLPCRLVAGDPTPRVPPEALPAGVGGWSWGGFLLTWMWAAGHRRWIGLLGLLPWLGLGFALTDDVDKFLPRLVWMVLAPGFAVALWLGHSGRRMAWEHRTWESAEQFRSVQRTWAVAGIFAWMLFIAIAIPVLYIGGMVFLLLHMRIG